MGLLFSLPYSIGESFIVTEGYHAQPTHIKKDEYALDFTQNGCEAYGKPAVAIADGRIILATDGGYNGGYGAEVLIDHGNNIVSRYAHLMRGSVNVPVNTTIRRGATVGEIGNTGLVAGNACNEHPGAHIHFAVYEKNGELYEAVKPEPLSGYQEIARGKWYLARNDFLTAAIEKVTPSVPTPIIKPVGVVAGASIAMENVD